LGKYGLEHHGQRANESECFFRTDKKHNVSVVNDGLALLSALAVGGVDTVGWFEAIITGDV
jgi:hypothetical protein